MIDDILRQRRRWRRLSSLYWHKEQQATVRDPHRTEHRKISRRKARDTAVLHFSRMGGGLATATLCAALLACCAADQRRAVDIAQEALEKELVREVRAASRGVRDGKGERPEWSSPAHLRRMYNARARGSTAPSPKASRRHVASAGWELSPWAGSGLDGGATAVLWADTGGAAADGAVELCVAGMLTLFAAAAIAWAVAQTTAPAWCWDFAKFVCTVCALCAARLVGASWQLSCWLAGRRGGNMPPSTAAHADALPRGASSERDSEQRAARSASCAICLEDLADRRCVTTACGHHYHARCLATWKHQKNTCPECRQWLGHSWIERD